MFAVRSQWARERIARAERRPHGPGVRPIGLWCSRHVQRLSPIRATRTWRAAVDPTTSAFHLDPGAFFAQKRHIRLAWDHCKPSRLSSHFAMSRFRWPGYRFETRWQPVGHIDAHSRWQMSRCALHGARWLHHPLHQLHVHRSYVLLASAGRGGLQPVTQPGRRRRLSPPRWRPGRCATPGPFPPVPCAGRRGLPARMRSIPHPLHTYAAACRPALTAKPAVRPAGGCCGGGLTDKVPGQGGHECNGRPWEALCGCSGRDDKLSCAAAQISMS